MSESLSLAVQGMKCGGCENKIITALSELSGVISVTASFQDNRVDVEFEPEQANSDTIEDTIIDLGFKVE